MRLRAYVRRTHLGHGHAYKAHGKYSYIETVIDDLLKRIYHNYFLETYLKGHSEEGELGDLERLAADACVAATERGVGCIVAKDERKGVPRPIFFSGNMVYVTGFFGQSRDEYVGMAHPTIFLLDRPANAHIARWIGRRWGHLADEDEVENLSLTEVNDCVTGGVCEVELEFGERSIVFRGVRALKEVVRGEE
ncbi:MAG: hypothetical protein QXJ59_06460 [Thermofilaceae archaeon]